MSCLTLSIAIFVASAMPGLASDDTNGVALSATPKAVQNTIHTRVGAGKLEGIDQSCENGEITFDVDWTEKTGEKRAFTVAEDGTLLSVQVELSQTPAEVQKAIQTESGGSPLKCLEKDVEDPDDISYDVLVAKDGRERWFTLDEDGTLLSKEITLGETPPPVQEAVRKKAAGNPVERIEEIFDAEITFEITITSSGGEKSFTAATNGVVLTEQVALENIPQPARKTIRQQIGEGKILRIDRSLVEKKMGVLPFQVQGRKDGKPFDFSVGPKGRFLGKDE